MAYIIPTRSLTIFISIDDFFVYFSIFEDGNADSIWIR